MTGKAVRREEDVLPKTTNSIGLGVSKEQGFSQTWVKNMFGLIFDTLRKTKTESDQCGKDFQKGIPRRFYFGVGSRPSINTLKYHPIISVEEKSWPRALYGQFYVIDKITTLF